MKSRLSVVFSRGLMVMAAALVSLHLALVAGCTGGGGGPDGRSTVQGNVNTFSVAGRFYAPEKEAGMWATIGSRVLEWVLPSAHAGIGGVTVHVQGTDITGTTDDRGNFILSGVPGGQQVIEFTYNGVTSTLTLNVPDYGLVKLSGVNVNDGGVFVREIEIEEYEDENENENENDNDDNGNDNDDDNGNDNDDDDDNGNDNDD